MFIESNHRDAPIKPLSSGERAILTKLCHWHDDSDATSAALGSPETPVWGAQEATAFPNYRIVCPPWWLGKSRQKPLAAVTFMAQFAFKFTARTQTTHRPTSHGPWPMLSVFDRRWPHRQRYPTLQWPDRHKTAPKKAVECHFSMFLAASSARRSPIAAVFLLCVVRLLLSFFVTGFVA